MLSLFARQMGRFRRDKRGNIVTLFALTLVPVLAVAGGAVDYSRADKIRTRLQLAADSASVGAVAKNSPAFAAAGSMSSDGPIPAGVTDATNIFNGNMAGQTGYTLNSLTVSVTRSSGTVTSTVQFSANVATTFMNTVGTASLTVTGSSTSVTSTPQYIDFYLLLDNSPSMGVAATPADVTTMVNHTSDKCAFACHDLSNSNNYYDLAKSLGVTTRIDVLRTATQSLMDTAAASETYSNQFRMAIYDFGGAAGSAGLRSLFRLSSSLTQRQDRRRQHRPDDGQWTKRQQRSGHQLLQRHSRHQQRHKFAGEWHVLRAAEVSVLCVRRRQ